MRSSLSSYLLAPRGISTLLIGVGIVLRAVQYLANGSLWIDEAALALNLLRRDSGTLLQPLDYAQLAPPGFLLIEKAVISVAGNSELALRAFPFAAGIAALFLFRVVARRMLPQWPAVLAVGLFSLGIPFIYFSAQVKQYSSDIAAALLLLAMAFRLKIPGTTMRQAWIVGLAGAALVWLSQTASYILIGIALAQLILVIGARDPRATQRFAVMWTLWGASVALAGLHALSAMTSTDLAYMRWFWSDGFMPVPPTSLDQWMWLPRRLLWVFGSFAPGLGWSSGGLYYRWSSVFLGLMICGLVVLWRSRREAALFLVMPVATVLILSALRLYPFTARLLAFLTPCFLILTAAGAGWVARGLVGRARLAALAMLAIVCGAPLFAVAEALPPLRLQHLRPVLERVRQSQQPSDRLYVFYGAIPAFEYYQPRLGLTAEHVVFGECSVTDARRYLHQLDRLRGSSRMWLIATHAQREGEVELMLTYLDTIGHRLDHFTVRGSRDFAIEHASGYLYDLSDPQKLKAASAETHPVSLNPVTGSSARWRCYGVVGGRAISSGPSAISHQPSAISHQPSADFTDDASPQSA